MGHIRTSPKKKNLLVHRQVWKNMAPAPAQASVCYALISWGSVGLGERGAVLWQWEWIIHQVHTKWLKKHKTMKHTPSFELKRLHYRPYKHEINSQLQSIYSKIISINLKKNRKSATQIIIVDWHGHKHGKYLNLQPFFRQQLRRRPSFGWCY